MLFKDYIQKFQPIKKYSVEILLDTGEKMIVENIKWKEWSLRLLQTHLWNKTETKTKFNLKRFCEYYDEWRNNPNGHHITINFLYRYNTKWWIIKKINY